MERVPVPDEPLPCLRLSLVETQVLRPPRHAPGQRPPQRSKLLSVYLCLYKPPEFVSPLSSGVTPTVVTLVVPLHTPLPLDSRLVSGTSVPARVRPFDRNTDPRLSTVRSCAVVPPGPDWCVPGLLCPKDPRTVGSVVGVQTEVWSRKWRVPAHLCRPSCRAYTRAVVASK